MPFGCVFRFPLGLRMVEELLAARGVIVSHETARQWARKSGQQFANQIRRRLARKTVGALSTRNPPIAKKEFWHDEPTHSAKSRLLGRLPRTRFHNGRANSFRADASAPHSIATAMSSNSAAHKRSWILTSGRSG